LFGNRKDLIEEAKKRILENPGKYVNHIYGQHEVGGTNVMCISSTPLENFGIKTDLDTTPIPDYSKPFLSAVPIVIIAGAALCTGLHWISKRRNEIAHEEVEQTGHINQTEKTEE